MQAGERQSTSEPYRAKQWLTDNGPPRFDVSGDSKVDAATG